VDAEEVCSVGDGGEGSLSRRPVLYFLEIPLVAFAVFAAWISSTDAASIVVALMVGVAAFALGFLILVWLYRFARRRLEQDVAPKRWEYWLERQGWWLLPPAIAMGTWASKFGANDDLGGYVAVTVAMALAGFCHGSVFLTPPTVPDSYLADTRENG
jgi:hypothetical protein